MQNFNHMAETEPSSSSDRSTWLCVEAGRVPYRAALALQHGLVAARRSGRIRSDVMLLLDHPPVFTLGRRGGRENLLVSDAHLQRHGVEVVPVERGGNITFHGPGQLVAYTIFDLQAARMGVTDFVFRLEEAMLRTAGDWNVSARRNPLNRGVWVGSNKMGSIGLAIRRGVTYHGLAFNVETDLTPFGWINPCGLQNVGVTSLQREAGRPVSLTEAMAAFKEHFSRALDAKLTSVPPADIESLAAA